MSRKFEIRCPIYGFIELDEWERDIVDHPVFQRLRRIRQLGWTDYVYPGAMHTRFEHSLGVMHMATLLFDNLVKRSGAVLSAYGDEDHLRRARRLVRLTALLHDVGHGPFSHVSEEVMPLREEEQETPWSHEDYSSEAIRRLMTDVLDRHPKNAFRIRAEEIANLLLGLPEAGRDLAWRPIVSGQLDADRMDYLLRDSHHCGVDYGHFGWQRLLNTVTAIQGEEAEGLRIGVEEGGWNAAESLVIARYMMFNQVYYHKTRVILDYHVEETLRTLLPDERFPPPQQIDEYLGWDDWKVLGLLAENKGGDHGRHLRERDLFKLVWASPAYPTTRDRRDIERVRKRLADGAVELSSEKSWYKPDKTDVRVRLDDGGTVPLSALSPFIAKMGLFRQVRFYAPAAQADTLRRRAQKTRRRDTT